jgi:DNA polymerase-3 subunit epsilon
MGEARRLRCSLDRPLAVFDIESTGISPGADRIIELSVVKITPNGKREGHTWRINPGVPIPQEATEVHGITDEDVADCPSFADVAQEVQAVFDGCDLCGYNLLRFDIPMLTEELLRAGIRFESDVLATIRVLEAQLERYRDLPRDIEALDRYCNPRDPDWADRTGRLKWGDGEILLNFGKRKGRPLRDIVENDPGLVKWILRSDFPRDTKEIVEAAVEGRWPQPPSANSASGPSSKGEQPEA